MVKRTLVLAAGVAWAIAASAQTPTSPGQTTTPPVATSASQDPSSVAPASVMLTGASLVSGNPAFPLPNLDLTGGVAFPRQRGSIDVEPVAIYPFLGLGVGYNDNITGVLNDKVGSGFFVVSPRVQAVAQTGGDVYKLSYGGNFGHYINSSANDFNDQAFIATSSNQFTSRFDLEAAAFFLVQHDPGGSVDRSFTGTPDRYHAAGALATFGYGAESAQGRIELDLAFTDKQYQNNLETTAAFNVRAWNAAGRFLYRVAPSTRLLAEVRFTDYDYTQPSSPFDSDEQRYLVGVVWDATAATSGTLRAGYTTKRFKQADVANFSGATVEALVRWLPRTYSTVELAAVYGPSDSTGTGIYTIDTSVGARWEHFWRSNLLTRTFATYYNSEFEGAVRTDRTGRVGFGIFYDIRSWLRIGADYSYEHRNSTDPTVEYSRNVILFSIAGTL